MTFSSLQSRINVHPSFISFGFYKGPIFFKCWMFPRFAQIFQALHLSFFDKFSLHLFFALCLFQTLDRMSFFLLKVEESIDYHRMRIKLYEDWHCSLREGTAADATTSLAFKWPNFIDDEKTFKTHSEHVYHQLFLSPSPRRL